MFYLFFLLKFLELRKPKINIDKIEVKLFMKKKKHLNWKVTFESQILKGQPNLKYLGIHLDRKSKWNAHIK